MLTDLQNFFTAGKGIKFALKAFNIFHYALSMLLHYLAKLKV